MKVQDTLSTALTYPCANTFSFDTRCSSGASNSTGRTMLCRVGYVHARGTTQLHACRMKHQQDQKGGQYKCRGFWARTGHADQQQSSQALPAPVHVQTLLAQTDDVWQALLQPPQCATLFVRFMHLPSHSVSPAVQTQVPAVHTVPEAHANPQPAQ